MMPEDEGLSANPAQRKSSQFLEQKALHVRKELLNMIYRSGTGHIGGALSTVDLLVTLFYDVLKFSPQNCDSPDRDRFILSKGHSCEAYYAILADRGFFPKIELEGFCKFDSLLLGHPHPKIPGVEIATGSLGHGLSVAAGMALAGKMDGRSYRVFCLTGDGELTEGSLWEAAMAAAHYRLDNLVCIIDCNGLQISGPTRTIMDTEPLAKKWRSFGWRVRETDGHSFPEIRKSLALLPYEKGHPSLLIAHTVKGKGISFMEGDSGWHHRVPKETEYNQAVSELNKMRV
jgi:transketolase